MPRRHAPAAARLSRGRPGVLNCALALLAGLVTATAAAESPFVPPDAIAGLDAVVAVEVAVDDEDARVAGPKPEGRGPGLDARIEERGERIARKSIFDPLSSILVHPPGPRASLSGPATLVDVGLPKDPFAPPTPGDFPVVRLQSPDVMLLPLATDQAKIEKTSLLSAITGTTGRLRGDYLTDFGSTSRVGVNALTSTWLGFGIDAEANHWEREVPDLGGQGLWTGDLNLIYNVFPHPRMKFRSGVGASWVVDDGEADAGWNLTHALDVYLLWRFMATGEVDYGEVDGDDLFRYRLALGLTWGVAEFFSGYESFKLGDEKLDGWVNGVSIWY